jgi:hydroxyacylglutathione hydrolase
MPKITEEVFYIPGQDAFMPDSHAYVLGKPTSEDLSLVDAGLLGKGSYKIQSIQKAGIELSSIKRIIMTHTHLDHIGCLWDGYVPSGVPVAVWSQSRCI